MVASSANFKKELRLYLAMHAVIGIGGVHQKVQGTALRSTGVEGHGGKGSLSGKGSLMLWSAGAEIQDPVESGATECQANELGSETGGDGHAEYQAVIQEQQPSVAIVAFQMRHGGVKGEANGILS